MADQMISIKDLKTVARTMENESSALLSVSDVAEILKTNVSYVYDLHRSGQIKFLKLGRLKCRKQALEEFLEKMEGMDVTDPFNIKPLEGVGHE